jgi:hypothetical protein
VVYSPIVLGGRETVQARITMRTVRGTTFGRRRCLGSACSRFFTSPWISSLQFGKEGALRRGLFGHVGAVDRRSGGDIYYPVDPV